MTPTNLDEWKKYIGTLSGRDLWSKAIAVNQIPFVRMLEEDGLSPKEITAVFRTFAQRLVEDGQEPPSRIPNGYLDYGTLLQHRGIQNVQT